MNSSRALSQCDFFTRFAWLLPAVLNASNSHLALEHDCFRLTRPTRAERSGAPVNYHPAAFFVVRDSGAAESTVQDAGWTGGQPAWQLRILSICANPLSPPSPLA
jgi:hypothetical protein